MLTTSEGDAEIQRSLAAGARGYLLKSAPPEELIEAIRQLHRGRKGLPATVAQRIAQLGRRIAIAFQGGSFCVTQRLLQMANIIGEKVRVPA